MKIEEATARTDLSTGAVFGDKVKHSTRRLGQLAGLFADETARAAMDADVAVYDVEWHEPDPEGTPGGLFFGTSTVHPGKVGEEFFMTRGHLHLRREAAEYYWGVSGSGLLLLADEAGDCRAEIVEPGSLHYIPGHTAHRLVNTGTEDLVVGACWGTDAGHDYGPADAALFGARVLDRAGVPTLVPERL